MTHATAVELADGLRTGRLDPVALAEEVYERIAAHGDSAIAVAYTHLTLTTTLRVYV